MTRRHALLLASTALASQSVDELASTLEMEEAARRKVAPDLFQEIAGSDRAAFDRITFRPRMMVNTLELDLSVDLFGHRHFAPIVAGPLAQQSRFHPEGESATWQGATAAKAVMTFPLESRKQEGPHWQQVDPASDTSSNAAVLVVSTPIDWKAFDRLRAATKTPIVIKGILSTADAKTAVQHGADGIVLSNYRKPRITGLASPMDVLPSIAAEVKTTILIDGSFRRGSDILKALALGAKAVLIGRPVLWGLAAYGARGVQQVIEQLQTELARDMAMCGLVKCSQATPQYVKIHRR